MRFLEEAISILNEDDPSEAVWNRRRYHQLSDLIIKYRDLGYGRGDVYYLLERLKMEYQERDDYLREDIVTEIMDTCVFGSVREDVLRGPTLYQDPFQALRADENYRP